MSETIMKSAPMKALCPHFAPGSPGTHSSAEWRMFFRWAGFALTVALLGMTARADKPPESGSARWHFERALVYVLEDSKQVDNELAASLAKDANYSEAHYFFATRYAERQKYADAAQEYRKAIQSSSREHLPARLGLAQSLFRQGEHKLSLNEILPVVKTLDQEVFSLELDRLQNALLREKNAEDRKAVQGQIEDLLERVDDFVKSTPESYRKYTFDKDLNDATVIFDIASLYEDADDSNEMLQFLKEAIKRRDGFSPLALMGSSRVLKTRKQIPQAAEALEKAIEQLKMLGFSEGKEIDTRELQELKKLAQKP